MLAVIVPSRGRPGNLARLVTAIERTKSTQCSIYTYLDHDDPAIDGYQEALKGTDVWRVVRPRIHFAAAVNETAVEAVAHGATHLAIFGDDVVPETPGWDERMVEALDGRLGVAYGSDGLEHLHGPDLPTHVIVPAELFTRLGWIALPTLRHLFCDNVWRELGKAVGNFQYVPGVKLTHLHRWNHRAPDDDTYREANDKLLRENDRRAFEHWRDNGGLAEAARLLGA